MKLSPKQSQDSILQGASGDSTGSLIEDTVQTIDSISAVNSVSDSFPVDTWDSSAPPVIYLSSPKKDSAIQQTQATVYNQPAPDSINIQDNDTSLTDTVVNNITPADTFTTIRADLKSEAIDRVRDINSVQRDWGLGIILLMLIALSWIRIRHRRYFALFLQSPIDKKSFTDLKDEDNPNIERISAVLHFIFAISFSLFLYYVSYYYEWENEYLGYGFRRFFSILVVIFCVYLIKASVLKIVGYIFQLEKISYEYILHTFLINKVLGIALIPISVLLVFSNVSIQPFLVVIGIIIISVSYFLRIFKGIRMYLRHQELSLLYIILYLCALEILPLVVLVKMFMLNFLQSTD